jgi:hypothetical protein
MGVSTVGDRSSRVVSRRLALPPYCRYLYDLPSLGVALAALFVVWRKDHGPDRCRLRHWYEFIFPLYDIRFPADDFVLFINDGLQQFMFHRSGSFVEYIRQNHRFLYRI